MIRITVPTDRAEWLRLRSSLFDDEPETEHLSEMDAYFANTPHYAPLVAVFVSEAAAGRLNGFLELSVRNYAEGCTGPTPYIEGWYVDADVRGRGIGRALVEAAETWARRNGYTEIASDALLDNTDSHAAHGALGFEEVERAVHFRKGL